ncbi:hypothetical protein KM1_022360 [Entamoeba histolytica HM-3:IMSS]|uniref:Uncharacterized protein n=4 Tax=Entamoeba histolytica TaxID=5759 RepID=C4M191_ENTH1|nr:hypothetical protein EHI_188170 [Entamoeba histolytica HM-1:IMSS]EMD49246.1 Hypothetical protein EHI5A_003460 [Entamoeba histolytica KU27]EMS12158.1 hypothetical protein KM1_022360 [Entamoeba histolytica HM-3:IMSS]BAN38586.1 hypothetical protein [Entamoeba histolytica]EAL48297.1 hypothetical protein EHI_188170 [Entamoeba histolytica HM-1:IMSS]BAN38921.1 hypothetical protein [Entamoeba histolytica]|eukprot:XP_653685.1 hypothetical protein EHI_188170 [Entamoeba histolytica HM-1:IMSS]
MKAFLFAFICVCALAEEDLFNPFIHGKTILKRMRTIKNANRRNERTLLALENRERKIENALDILYNDMKLAVDMADRMKIETQIDKLHKNMDKIRRQKRTILRRMRQMADKIALPDRDRLVRKTRIEHRVGLEENTHIRREIEHNQKLLLKETQALAHKYAKMAAEIASEKLVKTIDHKNEGDILKAKDKFKKVAKKAYNKYYKKIVERIEEATSEGVNNVDIKMVCRSAIDGLIRKLEHQYLTVVRSRNEAKKEAKKVLKKPLRKSMKTLSKKFKNTMTTKTNKQTKKEASKVANKIVSKK